MVGTYRLLEDVAISDAAFEAKGNDLSELFQACAKALFDTLVDVSSVGSSYEKKIELENKDLERLLFEFLEEIIYLKDAEYVVFSGCDVDVLKVEKYKLKAVLKGEKIDQKKQKLRSDVKAVTMHMFKVDKVKEGYKVTVVLDI